jgi:hypothetical protein
VGPWWYTIQYLVGALPDGAAMTFPFFASLCVRITSFVMTTLLTNSGNDPPVLSAMRSYSLVERPIMNGPSSCHWCPPGPAHTVPGG